MLQVGEVWQEINRELDLDGVRPISPDAEALFSICRISGDTAVSVTQEQSSILEQQKKEEIGKEEHMYKEVPGVSVSICQEMFFSQLDHRFLLKEICIY